jgi:hypothetical protein
MPAVSRRHLCCAASAALTIPLLSFIPAPDPDAEILAAVANWMNLRPQMEDLLRRRDENFDESMDMVGLCPMESYESNRSWWGAWRATPAGHLEEEYGRALEIADRHLTNATNTPAVTARGIEGSGHGSDQIVRFVRTQVERTFRPKGRRRSRPLRRALHTAPSCSP